MTAKEFRQHFIREVERLGIGTDADVRGTDAVDLLNELLDLAKQSKEVDK